MIRVPMRVFLIFVLLSLILTDAISQNVRKKKVVVHRNKLVILGNTSFVTKRDTVLYLTPDEIKKIKVKENPVTKSNRFYDTLQQRASKGKVTKEVADLVLKKKGRKTRVDESIEKSENKFLPFAGYTIGTITFKAVDLLEGSVT